MKKNHFFSMTGILAIVFFTAGCTDTSTSKEEPAQKPATETNTSAVTVTNPNFIIAPVEYSTLSEKAMNHMARFEFDAWGDMLADNVVYTFPDGDVETRTTLNGKEAVLAWWKNWKATSGIESMTMTEFNHIPVNVTAALKGGAPMGNYDIAYFSNKMVLKGKTVALRMNFTVHFNADKKIDRYTTYYDRSLIIKAMGKNILDELKSK